MLEITTTIQLMKNLQLSVPAPFTLSNLLQEQSRDLFDAATAYSEFLGRMIDLVEDESLTEEMRHIEANTILNIDDLTDVCEALGVPPHGIKCEAMDGLLREAKETTAEYECGAVCDAALIANAQRIAHYEIAGFGTASSFAKKSGLPKLADLYSDMAKRAGSADKALTKIAEGSWLNSGINEVAANAD